METKELKKSEKYVAKDQNNSTYSNDQLVQQFPVKDTPFTIVKIDEQHFVTMGKYRLSPSFQTMEEAEENTKDASWNRILQVIQIMIDENKTTNQNTKF